MKTIYPLSPGQEAMWLICQIAPESVAYNIFITAKIHAYLGLMIYCWVNFKRYILMKSSELVKGRQKQ